MYTESIGSNNVPAFLSKLWRLVDSAHNNDLISWSPSGKSFIIRNQAKFAKELLPLYFKHNNMASFIRQLNMYGFRKITHIENTGLKVENDEIEFYHSYFLKGQENLLEYIKRKNSLSVAGAKSNGSLEEKPNKEEVTLILTDVKDIKNRQDSVDSLLIRMQNENEALWKEIAVLRHKHQRQQQIVTRLMHFLLQLVQTGSISLKRKTPLMIDNKNGDEKLMSSVSNLLSVNTGPIIQEITHGLLEDDDELDEIDNVGSPIVNSALSESGEPAPQFDDPNDSPIFVQTPTSNLNQPPNSEQLSIQAIENDLKEATVFDPLQESINAINADDDKATSNLLSDQILDLEAVGAVPLVEGPSLLVQNNSNLIQQSPLAPPPQNLVVEAAPVTSSMPNSAISSSNLRLVMPSTTEPANAFIDTNCSLVPSTSTSVLSTPNITMENIDNHLEGIDSELSSLQEQLLFGNFNIDSNVLMGLFSNEEQPKADAIQFAAKDLPAIGDASGLTTSPLSTPRPIRDAENNRILNSNFELCDIVDADQNLFADNQADLLNAVLTDDSSLVNKNLSTPTFENVVDNSQIFNADDLLTTDAEINQLLSQTADDQDLYRKESKRKRLS